MADEHRRVRREFGVARRVSLAHRLGGCLCAARINQRDGAAAEPGAAEPGAIDALGGDEDFVEIDEGRAAALVVVDGAATRLGHELPKRNQIAVLPGVDAAVYALHFAEEMSCPACRCAGERVAELCIFAVCDVPQQW